MNDQFGVIKGYRILTLIYKKTETNEIKKNPRV